MASMIEAKEPSNFLLLWVTHSVVHSLASPSQFALIKEMKNVNIYGVELSANDSVGARFVAMMAKNYEKEVRDRDTW